jgi:Fe2+ transport system protein B
VLEFIIAATLVFLSVSVIVKSRCVFLRSIPYVLYIYLFLLFFEDSALLLKIIIFTILLALSVILILYKDFQEDNLPKRIG